MIACWANARALTESTGLQPSGTYLPPEKAFVTTSTVAVGSVAEQDAVLTRLETSDFAEGPAKAATKPAPC